MSNVPVMLDTAERSSGRREVITAFLYLSFLPLARSATACQLKSCLQPTILSIEVLFSNKRVIGFLSLLLPSLVVLSGRFARSPARLQTNLGQISHLLHYTNTHSRVVYTPSFCKTISWHVRGEICG